MPKQESCKKRAKPNAKVKTEDILGRLKIGLKPVDIARELDVTPSRVYSVKKYYKDDINTALAINNNINITNYTEDINNNLKCNIIRLSNALSNKDLSKAPLGQIAAAIGTLIDKQRLIEGKSTQNIATQVLHNMNPEQMDIIKESIKSLKLSFTNDSE